jgi:iron complex outermembrane receptor protein
LLSASPGRTDEIAGSVIDIETAEAVEFVIVTVRDSTGAEQDAATTDSHGRFSFTDLLPIPHEIMLSRIGYENLSLAGIVPGSAAASDLVIAMTVSDIIVEEMVVTASRQRETGLQAPISTSVAGRARIEETTMLTPVDPARSITGVDFASKGLTQHTFAVRGERSANSGALLVMTDYRFASVPSLDLNVPYLLPNTGVDMDRIEVCRGPCAALYGPNSDRGVLHILTRSPFHSQGTSLSLSAGSRSLWQTSLRHAGSINDDLAYKISAEYFRATDWEYADPVEEENRWAAIDQGADPAALLIGRTDFDSERVAGEARIDWEPAAETSLIFTHGIARAVKYMDLTQATGRVQMRDWTYPYYQARFTHKRLFANLMYNSSDAGDTYLLRSGNHLVDSSRLWAAQLQHSANITDRHRFLYGIDVRGTDPRTGGTIHGRNENNDSMAEVGGYLHANSLLSPKVLLTGALRVDYHDRINDLAVSPRLGVVYNIRPAHAVRLTYNRAFSSPDANDLFIDLKVQSLPGLPEELPYDMRFTGVPEGGFLFTRNSGQLSMNSPTATGEGSALLPADATETWETLVDILDDAYPGLSSVPQPDGSQVATDLRVLNLDSNDFMPIDTDEITKLEPYRRVITNSLEIGYKSIIADRATAAVDVHVTQKTDEFGENFVFTPNVFYNEVTLRNYLVDQGLAEEEAEAIAGQASALPMGTVAVEGMEGSTDLLIASRQGGQYTFWGVDLSLEVNLTERLRLGGNYSWLHKNEYSDIAVIGDVVLSVPENKGAAYLGYRDQENGFNCILQGRAVESFRVVSGVYRGRVESYAVLDVNVGYRLPGARHVLISIHADNLLDNRHREYIGAAELGRIIVGRMQIDF